MTFIMGNVILVDVLSETPPRFRIRLHGTNLVQYVGYELTGKMLDELPQTEFREAARQTFTHVFKTRAIGGIASSKTGCTAMRRSSCLCRVTASRSTGCWLA